MRYLYGATKELTDGEAPHHADERKAFTNSVPNQISPSLDGESTLELYTKRKHHKLEQGERCNPQASTRGKHPRRVVAVSLENLAHFKGGCALTGYTIIVTIIIIGGKLQPGARCG